MDKDPTATPKVTKARPTTSGSRRRSKPAPTAVETSVPTPAEGDAIEISGGDLGDAGTRSIGVTQGGLSVATADAIEVHQGGIGRATATDIAVSTGGIGLARGDRVSLERGVVGAALGRENRVIQSLANLVAGNDATVDQSIVQTLVGNRVIIRQPSAIGIVIAARVEGSVRPVLDWRGALAAGAAIGLVLGVLRRR